MLKIGLDIETGFVKCMSDYVPVRFPSIYAKRIHGSWTDTTTEVGGAKAQSMLDTMGTTAIAPISVLPRCALHALPDTGRYLPTSVTNESVISTTHPINRFMVNRSPPAQPPQSTPLSTNRVILHMLYMRSGR